MSSDPAGGVVADLVAVQRRIAAIAGDAGAARQGGPSVGASAALGGAAFERLVRREAAAAHVDPELVAAVARTESGLNPGATSPTGAAGLMQLMPATARSLGIADPYDPAANVRGGAIFLRQLLDRFGGDVPLAVAAYNAGPGAVDRYGGIPPYAETRRYVTRVLDLYHGSRERR
jgi:soluble lytic murein transglycosylase-like protein